MFIIDITLNMELLIITAGTLNITAEELAHVARKYAEALTK